MTECLRTEDAPRSQVLVEGVLAADVDGGEPLAGQDKPRGLAVDVAVGIPLAASGTVDRRDGQNGRFTVPVSALHGVGRPGGQAHSG